MSELKIQTLKDRDKTFELGKFTAISKAQPVVVVDSHRAVMSFNAQGDFSEVMVRPLRVSMASMLLYTMEDSINDYPSNRNHRSFIAAASTLKGYESRGGKL